MPPRVTARTQLKLYTKQLKRSSVLLTCPHCHDPIPSGQYEKHCTHRHDLDARTACVWCQGDVAWSWGQKQHHVDHLLQCWEQFKLRYTCRLSSPPSSAFNSTPLCAARDFFGRTPWSLPRAYETVWPLPLDPLKITFRDDALNWATATVFKFLTVPSYWVHAMVKVDAWPSFIQALDEEQGRIRTLLFSTWCDGGPYPNPRHREHKHLVLVAPSQRHLSEQVWQHVRVPRHQRPVRNFPCKRLKRIETPMHLVNTLQYLSQRQSRCTFSFEKYSDHEAWHHYYIAVSVPLDLRYAVVMVWEAGPLTLVHQQYRHMDVRKLLHVPMDFVESQWMIRVTDLPDVRLHVVLPMAHGYFPSIDWVDVWFTPSKVQQKILRIAKPLMLRVETLEKENRKLVEQRAVHETLRDPRKAFEKEKNLWKEQLESEQKEKKLLREQLESEQKEKKLLREQLESEQKEKKLLREQLEKVQKEKERFEKRCLTQEKKLRALTRKMARREERNVDKKLGRKR